MAGLTMGIQAGLRFVRIGCRVGGRKSVSPGNLPNGYTPQVLMSYPKPSRLPIVVEQALVVFPSKSTQPTPQLYEAGLHPHQELQRTGMAR